MSGTVSLNTDSGVFTYTSVSLAEEIAASSEAASVYCGSGSLYIVSLYRRGERSGSALFKQHSQSAGARCIEILVHLFSADRHPPFVLASLVAVARAQRKEVRYFSEYDALTGIYNRRTGYQKLSTIGKDVGKGQRGLHLLYRYQRPQGG